MAIFPIEFSVTNMNSNITGIDSLSIALDEGSLWYEAFREIAINKIPIYTVNSQTIGEWTPEKNVDFDVIKRGIEQIQQQMKDRPLSEKISQMQEYCDFQSGVGKNPLTWGLYTNNFDYQSHGQSINGPAILLCPENIIKSIQGKRLMDHFQEILALVLAHECAHYYMDTEIKASVLGQIQKQNQQEKELVQAVMEESLANTITYSCHWKHSEKLMELLNLQAINYCLAVRWLNGSLLNDWLDRVLQDWCGEGDEEVEESRKELLQTLLTEPDDTSNTPYHNDLKYWPFLVNALLFTAIDLDAGLQILLKPAIGNQAEIAQEADPSIHTNLFHAMRLYHQTGEQVPLIDSLFKLHVQNGLEVNGPVLIHELNQLRILNPASALNNEGDV